MNDAILFDFNGGLVDGEEQHRIALTRVGERLGAGMPCVTLTTSHSAAAFPDADAVWPSLAGRGPADVRSLLDR